MTDMRFDATRPVAIIGGGVMGTKVAWACARAGIPTRLYEIDAAQRARAADNAASWGTAADKARVAASLSVSGDLTAALDGAQLAFENVPEDLALKTRVLGEIGAVLAPDALMGSNTSSLTCSPLAAASGRPALFFNMNFSDPRTDRLVEIMLSPLTAPATLDFALAWARAIAMVPVVTRKERMGYSFNRLWRAIKKEVLRQVEDGHADPQDIDRAWILSFGTSMGPFGMMDEIGLTTIRKIEQQYYLASGDPTDAPPAFLDRMIAEGKLGVSSGEGFYTHPDPAYRRKGWLDNTRTPLLE